MLVALVALMLFGSSGTSSFLAALERAQGSIEAQIEDRGRRAELLALVENAERSMKSGLKNRGKASEALAELLRRHDTEAADIEPALARLGASAQAAQDEMLRYRFDLKGRMSRDEWARVFPQVR